MPEWRFLSNHAQVLICIAADPGTRLRDIAVSVGITERAAHRIVDDLVEGGYMSRERVGRRNRYRVKKNLPLREPLLRDRNVADLLHLFAGSDGEDGGSRSHRSERARATAAQKRGKRNSPARRPTASAATKKPKQQRD